MFLLNVASVDGDQGERRQEQTGADASERETSTADR